MNYLFFDIECANCYQGKGKICSFGYVLTDTGFNVLDKYDIVINPASKFNLGPDIVLAYDKSTFKRAPMFPSFYSEITTLLEDEDTLVFGFSASNDAKYLSDECTRYDLPSIDYKLYDVQQMIMGIKETRNQPSLIGSCLELGIDENQDVHKSDDDSLMTMELLKALCEKYSKTPDELISLYPNCKGVSENYKFEWTSPLPKPVKEKTVQNVTSNRMNRSSDNYKNFIAMLSDLTPDPDPELPLHGKKICLSAFYEEKHFRQMKLLAQFINDAGGKYVTRTSDANLFVEKKATRANGEIRECPRLNTVNRMISKGKKVSIISFDELLSILLLDSETLDGMADAMMIESTVNDEKIKNALITA